MCCRALIFRDLPSNNVFISDNSRLRKVIFLSIMVFPKTKKKCEPSPKSKGKQLWPVIIIYAILCVKRIKGFIFFGLTKLFHTFSFQMLTGAALSGTVSRKGREIHGSGEKKREVACAVSLKVKVYSRGHMASE